MLMVTTFTAYVSLDTPLVNDEVVYVQWRLLRYVGQSGVREEWHQMAVKVPSMSCLDVITDHSSPPQFARRLGLLSELVPYEDISIPIRMKILKVRKNSW
jgi:hypothetical protein